jgi:maleylpyruvate isomerase
MTVPTLSMPTLHRHLAWVDEGHRYFIARLEQMGDEELGQATTLPGWTGRHLLSHVGHNAQALARLAHWASSGEPTPMYRDATARADEIELGASWPVPYLRQFVQREQDHLVAVLDDLVQPDWLAHVVTAQGRTVPATTIPWLRGRELWVHASDLQRGGGFEDFPPDFVDELLLDVMSHRRRSSGLAASMRAIDRSPPIDPQGASANWVEGRAAELARWLTGRGGAEALRTNDGASPPELSPWL